jgi:hypothetical protein
VLDPETKRLTLEVGLIGFIGALVGGLVSGAYQHLRDYFRRPVLKFHFQGCTANELDSPYLRHGAWADDSGTQRDWIVIRASIQNSGRTTAKQCRVYLIELSEIHDGKKTTAGFHDSVSLPWAGWDFLPRDIPPSVNSFLDVVRFRKDEPALNFTFSVFSGDRKGLNSFSGIYRFRMVATADNAAPVYREISIDYQGNWHNVRGWDAA